MKFSGKFMIAFLACTLAAGGLMAQTTRGDIQGHVVDDAGVALPGVTVSIDSDALIGTQSTVSDSNGTYKFLVLPPGSYKATYSLSSFQTRSQEAIAVRRARIFPSLVRRTASAALRRLHGDAVRDQLTRTSGL